MRIDVVIHLKPRKPLAGMVHSGLALLRRARGTSVHCALPGTRDENDYGPNPYQIDVEEVFA